MLHVGVPKLDRPTLTALGIQVPITGDDNFNSTVTVQFRVSGTQAWQNALPLFRVHPETVAAYTVTPQFGGSIFDLRPATSYDIQLHAVDPDGVDQTFNLNGVTRPVPGDPATPRVRNVTDSASLWSAMNSALPGDVITLANGFYPGQFQMYRAGTAANPIVIRGVSEDGVILDGGNCLPCNIFEVYGAGYVHLERLTMQNAERAIRFQQAGSIGNVVRRVHVKNTIMGMGGQFNQLDLYIADNIFEGRLTWPHIYDDDSGAFANQDGIAVFGFGHVVTHNRISGYGDAMTTGQDGARANDFYGNDIVYTYDNGLELDGSEGNTRALRNRFMNTYIPLSVQPVHGGPSYIMRNVSVNIVSEQVKFHSLNTSPPQEPSGVLVYNNTFVSPPGIELTLQTPAGSHYFEFQNNLFLAPSYSGPEAADWTGPIDHGLFDYNGYFPNGIFRFNVPALGGYFFQPNFAGLQSLGMETHGLIASGSIFASGLTAPNNYRTLLPPADAALAAGSIVLNRARVLPNVNDSFQGSGPDLGALEQGCPAPTYGPRPEGIDESNEVVGCGAAPSNTTSISVSPAAISLGRSTSQQFTATTVPAGGAVNWSISPARGTITPLGIYTSPADALLGEQVTVTATSTTNGAVFGTATVYLSGPIVVTLTPASVTLSGNQSQQFTATVTGAMNTGVSWIISPPVGAVTAGGLYYAPAATSTTQTTTLTAVSVANSTKQTSAVITISANGVSSVSVSPANVTVGRSQTQQFSVTTVPAGGAVNWSITPARGAISSTGLYTAPADGLLGEQVSVKAVSTTNSALSSTATVNLTAPVAVSVNPASVSLAGSATQQFAASVTGAVNGAVNWALNPALGTVSASGLFTAPPASANPQTVTLTATSVADASKSASAGITVAAAQTTSVTVSPATFSLGRSQSQQFTATTNPAGSPVTWKISPTRGTITATGLYTAPADALLGEQVLVTATSTVNGAVSGGAIVNLTAPVTIAVTPGSVTLSGSQSQQFSASINGALDSRVTWSINPALGTVTAGGLFTAPAAIATAQTITLTATSVADTTKFASAAIIVAAAQTTSVTVSPGTATVGRSQTQQFTASTNPSGSPVTWSISPARGTVSATGAYTAPADALLGEQVLVTATSTVNGAVSGGAIVNLTAPVTIAVTPGSVTLSGSQSQQFSTSINGALDSRVTWSINPALGTVTAGGLFTAPAAIATAQTITLTATSVADTTKFASAAIIVAAAQTTSVTVSPGTATVGRSQTQQFTASTNPSGSPVTWSISPARGTVSATGAYTAPADALLGEQVLVTATSTVNGAVSGGAIVNLTAPVTIAVTPGSVTLSGSQSQQFSASINGALDSRVTWSINPAGGTVTASGLFTAPPAIATPQTFTVVATSVADPTKSASAGITVAAAQTTSVSVSPAAFTLGRSQSQQFTASTNPTGSPVTWRISPARGTITATGLYTAPADALLGEQVLITATSTANAGVSGSAIVSLTAPVTVTLTPLSVTLNGSQSQQFSATVNGAVDNRFNWILTPASGTITAVGFFTAPAATSIAQTITLQAVSTADGNSKATAIVTVNAAVAGPPAIAIPNNVLLKSGSTLQFAVYIGGVLSNDFTWAVGSGVGTITSGGFYTSPVITGYKVVTLLATGISNPSQTAKATIVLTQ